MNKFDKILKFRVSRLVRQLNLEFSTPSSDAKENLNYIDNQLITKHKMLRKNLKTKFESAFYI